MRVVRIVISIIINIACLFFLVFCIASIFEECEIELVSFLSGCRRWRSICFIGLVRWVASKTSSLSVVKYLVIFIKE